MVVASQMTTLATDDSNLLSRYLPSRVARGFVVAIISGLFFTGLNASVKELAHEMPPLFVSWGRWVAGIALMAPIMIWQGGIAGLATRDLKLHCFRGLFHTSGYALWYEAVVWLPLATVASLITIQAVAGMAAPALGVAAGSGVGVGVGSGVGSGPIETVSTISRPG